MSRLPVANMMPTSLNLAEGLLPDWICTRFPPGQGEHNRITLSHPEHELPSMATSATCDLEHSLPTDGQAIAQYGEGDSLINALHRRWSNELDNDRAYGTVEPIHGQPVMLTSSVVKDDAMGRNNAMDDQSRTTEVAHYPNDKSVSDQIHYAPQFIRSSQDLPQAIRSYTCAPSDQIHYAPQFIRSSQDLPQAIRSYTCAPSDQIHYAPQFIRLPQELPQPIRSPLSAPSDQIIWPPMRQAVYAPTAGRAAPQTTYAPPIHQAVYAPTNESFTSLGKRSYSQSQDSGCGTHVFEGESSMGVSSRGEAQPTGISLPANLTKEMFARHYEHPMVDAAAILGLSVNSMREKLRSFHIKRWPNRVLGSITSLIEDMPRLMENHAKCQELINKLYAQKLLMLRDPNLQLPPYVRSLRQQLYKRRHLKKVETQTSP